MSAPVWLSPAARDTFLETVDRLLDGSARLDGHIVVRGHSVVPLEVLISAAYSQDRFPAVTAELLMKALGFTTSCGTYGEVSRVLLANMSRVEVQGEEAEAFERVIQDEERVERETAERKQEIARRKAEREAQQTSARRDIPDPSRRVLPPDAEQRRRAKLLSEASGFSRTFSNRHPALA